MSFTLGALTAPIGGNITTLNAILLADPRAIESNLGYHPGRLAGGFKILLLRTLPTPAQFEFDGTTLRSGGRVGLPADDAAADAARPRVHDQITAERGADGYAKMQEIILRDMQVTGPKRLVKIMPETRHDDGMAPSAQYPMGGGFAQYKLKAPGMPFLFAASLDGKGVASIPGDSLPLNSGNFTADYPNRAKLQSYLQRA
ncbi:MAG: hypothetical protein AAFN94_08055 [Pseudomonadota bacterium]